MAGGIRNAAMGRNFGHGFLAAAVTAGGSGLVDSNIQDATGRVFASAAIGGTAAALGGGKFANGAVTGAYSRMFNDGYNHGEEKRWTYSQKTGKLTSPEGKVYQGYSGKKGVWQNNPDMQHVKDHGPIPRGRWEITNDYYSNNGKHLRITLEPMQGTEVYGRSGFEVHADDLITPGTASSGCIVAPRAAREQMQIEEGEIWVTK